MWRRTVELTSEQREELTRTVKRDPKAYRRERAAAILHVADGAVAHQVALRGLLVRRAPDTVYGWLDRYAEHGLVGLLEILASDPRDWGRPQSRWTLEALRDAVPSYWAYSLSGLWRILARHRL